MSASAMVGARLGAFQITGALGAGGMGEVYRARDARLDREVAIKVLPAAFAADPERLARFEREAKLLASLNHPSIAHVYGFESATLDDGASVHFLAMELVEGEDLAERLKRGAIPVDEALPIAKQIAEALEEAHERGIVHRDLKPANVKVTPDGKIKVLDFGLAKALASDPMASSGSSHDLSQSPTLAGAGTMAGVILGTAAYMSPEQARGKAVDQRADIWAFGVVLFEMLTGRRLFEGDTVSDVLAAVLTKPMPWRGLPPGLPAHARDSLERCLERDPRRRLRDIGDLRLEGGAGVAEAAPAAAPRRWQWPLVAVAGLALVSGALWLRDRPPEARVERFALPLAAGRHVDANQDGFALSPDGTVLVYSVRDDAREAEDGGQLFAHRIGDLDPTPLPGTEGGRFPFFSRDGREIGFFAHGKLKRTLLSAGSPRTVCDAVVGRGGTWGPDGTIVFSAGGVSGGGVLSRVAAGGGEPTPLTRLVADRREFSHRWPWFLPDGRHVLFVAQTGEGTTARDQSTIEALSLDTKERKPLFAANSSVAFVEKGHILYWHEGAALARRFDPRTLEVSGEPVSIADGVAYGDVEFGAFVASGQGDLVYQQGQAEGSALDLYAADGRRLQAITESTGSIVGVRLSPDGARVAYSQDGDIWVSDLERGTATRLSFDPAIEEDPIWSPDGAWIAYVSKENSTIHRKRASGAGEAERAFAAPQGTRTLSTHDWSSDGQSLLVALDHPDHPNDLAAVGLRDGALTFLTATPFIEVTPSSSPGGKWLAYASDATGRMEVYVESLAGARGRWQVSRDGGGHPRWSRDGRRLYYLRGNWTVAPELVSVEVQATDLPKIGVPRKVMEVARRRGSWAPFDVGTDETWFVWNARVGGIRGPQPFTVVRNWQRLLEGRPTGAGGAR